MNDHVFLYSFLEFARERAGLAQNAQWKRNCEQPGAGGGLLDMKRSSILPREPAVGVGWPAVIESKGHICSLKI